MRYLFYSLIAVLSVELILRLGIVQTARAFGLQYGKIGRVMLSKKISDTWKEKALMRYAVLLLGQSLRLALMLIMVAVAAMALIWLPGYLSPALLDLREAALSWSGLAWITGFAVVYALARSKWMAAD